MHFYDACRWSSCCSRLCGRVLGCALKLSVDSCVWPKSPPRVFWLLPTCLVRYSGTFPRESLPAMHSWRVLLCSWCPSSVIPRFRVLCAAWRGVCPPPVCPHRVVWTLARSSWSSLCCMCAGACLLRHWRRCRGCSLSHWSASRHGRMLLSLPWLAGVMWTTCIVYCCDV